MTRIMTDSPKDGDNVTRLDAVRDAYKNAKPHKPKTEKPKGKGKGGGDEPPAPPRDDLFPPVLPPDSPVQALGVNGRDFFFLNAREQFQVLKDTDITMNPILALFGNGAYLRDHWPKYDRSGKFVINFDHGMLREVLISSCHMKGIWSPEDNVRGVGAWMEDDGTLVMHKGDRLFLSNGMSCRPGLRDHILYPAAPSLPHPVIVRPVPGGAAYIVEKKLCTWNWERGAVDAKLYLGHMVCSKLGAAQPERPIAFITGQSGCGKSKLSKLKRWIMSQNGVIRSEDATEAYIRQRVANTSLPVSIDEAESEGDERSSKRLRAIVKLARLAFTGAEQGRGQPGGQAQTFTGRNTFEFSAIVKPSLPEQDMNRMFVGQLNKIEWDGAKKERQPGEDWEEDEEEEDAEDIVLGSRQEWERIGQQLDGIILGQWKRYRKTLRAYKRALERAGHKSRGQDQFGALGAGYDLVMFDDDDTQCGYVERAREWAAMLPADSMPETSGYVSTHEACLKYLLGAAVDFRRDGGRTTIGQLMIDARKELEESLNDPAAARQLEQNGIKIFRDKRDMSRQVWWIAISHINPGLARIYRDSDWQGIAGAPGAWAQMLQRLRSPFGGIMTKTRAGAPLRLRFIGQPEYCTAISWETAFPPRGRDDEDDYLVAERDRYDGFNGL